MSTSATPLAAAPPTEVELGFAVPLRDEPPRCALEDTDWSNWDGGKIGGRPVRAAPERHSSVLCRDV
jgi:hypothetical protein